MAVEHTITGEIAQVPVHELEQAFQQSNANKDLVELRLKSLELAFNSCNSPGGNPRHVGYVAGDLYRFLLTGEKPAGPPESRRK